MRSRLWNRQPISSPDHTHYLLRRNPFVQIGPLNSLGLGTELDKRWLISNEGTKTLTGFFATFYARGSFGNSALPKLALVLSANFGDLLRPVHPHLFRHQMITYLTRDYRIHRSNLTSTMRANWFQCVAAARSAAIGCPEAG
jgi:hypothetical protein